MAADCRFFTVAGADYFIGLVALLNSLRLTGHGQELVVLDLGLTRSQRRLLEPHATAIPLAPADARRTLLATPLIHRYATSGVTVLLDSDIIVTSSLTDIIEQAVGSIAAYPDNLVGTSRRWFAEWATLFALRAPLRHQMYVNGGFLAMDGDRLRQLGPRWEELSAGIPLERVFRQVTDPLWAANQDVLNALLMSELEPEALIVLPDGEMAFPTEIWEVEIDFHSLRAQWHGQTVRMLHYAFSDKPWQPAARLRLNPRDAYLRVLPRLLLGEDVTLRLDPSLLPLWLRAGIGGWTARAAAFPASALYSSAARQLQMLPEPLRKRVRTTRRRLLPRSREFD